MLSRCGVPVSRGIANTLFQQDVGGLINLNTAAPDVAPTEVLAILREGEPS